MNTRIAPSPTGPMHIGTARTAYFNWLAARSTGGRFILRIDDTDRARSSALHEDGIRRTIDWLGLDYDSTFRQSDRLDRYRDVADGMVRDGAARVVDGAVMFLMPHDVIFDWTDNVFGRVDASDEASQDVGRMVLIKSDGTPSYHFATVVDDHDSDIDLVLRGSDHVANTVKHLYLYAALGWTPPAHAHVGLIHHNGRKISKRDGLSSIDAYTQYGPDAVLNALLMLGWGHPDKDFDRQYPLVTKDDAVMLFPQGRLRKQASQLDLKRIARYQRQYNGKGKSSKTLAG